MNLLKNTKLLALANQGTQLGGQFLLFLLLVRWFSKEDMGIWTIYLAIHTLLETARTSFLQNGLIRLLGMHPDKREQILASAVRLQVIGTLILGLAFPLVFSLFFLKTPWAWLAFGYPLVAVFSSWNQLSQALQIAKGNWMAMVQGAAIQTVIWIGGAWLLSYFGVFSLFTMQGVQAVGLLAAAIRLSWGQGLSLRKRHDQEMTRELWQFGRFSWASGVGSMLFNKTDILMLGWMMGPVEAAVYGVATRLIGYAEIPLTALGQHAYPELHKLKAGTARDWKERLLSIYKSMYLILIPQLVALCIWPAFLVRLIAGEGYDEAAPLIILLAFGVLVKPLGRMGGQLLDALGRPDINLRNLLLSAGINMVLNLAFIYLWGMAGAALATLVATWVNVGIGQYRVMQLSPGFMNVIRA
jgi:O-antigen/teichoic acid export membrane protein